MTYKTLTPAYGRDYTSAKAVKEAFNSDQDFIIADMSDKWDGRPVNREQLIELAPITLNIRYKKLAAVAQVVIK